MILRGFACNEESMDSVWLSRTLLLWTLRCIWPLKKKKASKQANKHGLWSHTALSVTLTSLILHFFHESWQETSRFMHIHIYLEKAVLSNGLAQRYPVKRASPSTFCFWIVSRAASSRLSWGRLVPLVLAPLNPGCLLSGLQNDCCLQWPDRISPNPFLGSHPKLMPSGNES